tara:strand:- start:156 stop:770 length:615 start_codon:yes stop_codon:yes gene_type:complete
MLTEEEIKFKLKHFTLGKKIWKEFAPLRNYNELQKDKARPAAVGIHIENNKGNIRLILIERAKYNGKHSQQIAFPGGKSDPSDLNLEQTARRESFEEIGFGLSEGMLIGELSEVYIPVSGFTVKPFVFFHQKFPNIKRNKREVKQVMICDLNDIDTLSRKSHQNIKVNDHYILKNVPGILFKSHFIWGATALMLHEFNTALKTF